MAGISTAIEIQDRVSGSLNRITAALYNTTYAFQDVDRASETTFNTSGVQAMTQELYAYEDRIQQIESELVGANRRLEQMEEQTYRATQASNILKNAFRGVIGILSTMGVGKIIEISDNLIQATARLNNMNDGLQATNELVKMVYASAQNARGSFAGMTDVVARFGNNAKDAFGSSAEVVSFANLIQKQMTIAGASTEEAANAMLQLSQGLGSGVLRGDELSSIFEQAPNLIQNIADYLDVPIGEIRDMASEGQLTADVVKNAIFSASDEINEKFNQMPMTWGQIWQSMQNTALMKFQPVMQRINDIANSEKFQTLVDNATSAMAMFANTALNIFDTFSSMATFATNNWSVIGPIVYGVLAVLGLYAAQLGVIKGLEIASIALKGTMAIAHGIQAAAIWLTTSATWAATTAQLGLNGAMYACPIAWVIMAVIVLIAIITALCNWIAKTTEVTQSGLGIIVGAFAVAGAGILNIVLGLMNFIIGIGVELYNLIATFANFFANVFNNPVGAIINLFSGMFDFIVGIVQSAAAMIDAVLGSDLSGAVAGFRNMVADGVADIIGEQTVVMEKLNASDYMVDAIDYGDAFSAGADLGDGIADKLSGLTTSLDTSGIDSAYTSTDVGSVADNLSGIANDTSNISKSVDISNENLKYLRDIAERDVINRFTTAEIRVDMQNNNTINNGMDIDGVVRTLTEKLREAMEYTAEGVHA